MTSPAARRSDRYTRSVELDRALQQLVQEAGPWTLPTLFGAALLEYVFPPFPGDLITLLGAFSAVHGVLPLPLVFLASTAGSVAGAALDYELGRRLGRAAERRLPEEASGSGWRRFFSRERLHVIEEAYRRRGPMLIVFNRFLPGIRGLFFVAAGAAGMPLRQVLGLGALSAALWNGALLAAGFAVGENLPALLRLLRDYATVAWGGLLLGVIALLARALSRRAAARRAPPGT